jgi:phosphoglycerate-specific signal transduction histidine kinase
MESVQQQQNEGEVSYQKIIVDDILSKMAEREQMQRIYEDRENELSSLVNELHQREAELLAKLDKSSPYLWEIASGTFNEGMMPG